MLEQGDRVLGLDPAVTRHEYREVTWENMSWVKPRVFCCGLSGTQLLIHRGRSGRRRSHAYCSVTSTSTQTPCIVTFL